MTAEALLQQSRERASRESTQAPCARRVSHPDGLASIHEPCVSLSLWQRQLGPAITNEVAQLAVDALPDVRCLVDRRSPHDGFDTLLRANGLAPEQFPHWRTDVLQLIDRFQQISDAAQVTLRLETTRSDGCTRFHIDQTTLRLLCTYQGPGTEWLHSDQVDLEKLRSGAANPELIRWGTPERFATGEVGIMRGSRYGTGLAHRSPSMHQEQSVRVLLCLDADGTGRAETTALEKS